ncbi:ATP-binding cassette domain-containing protein [Clostridium sp.]|uniref:ATP-binding cassette domain-containing protein n=1 Tax=Clostridium sp. TaxID=1506 RepID=UPI002636CF5A|nr:ATP-binding cassette domain-containing protein [Clostridium sp.]
MDIVKIQNLSKSFGNSKIIDDVSFCVPEHSIFGFIGQNGAGKTTTMKMILGLLKADNGSITVCNEKVSFGETKTNKYIGYLPDYQNFMVICVQRTT